MNINIYVPLRFLSWCWSDGLVVTICIIYPLADGRGRQGHGPRSPLPTRRYPARASQTILDAQLAEICVLKRDIERPTCKKLTKRRKVKLATPSSSCYDMVTESVFMNFLHAEWWPAAC